jgi:hypothetical protein
MKPTLRQIPGRAAPAARARSIRGAGGATCRGRVGGAVALGYGKGSGPVQGALDDYTMCCGCHQ